MNITLISTCANIYSFGMRTLSSCLKQDKHNVKNIFLAGNFLKKYEDSILDEVISVSEGSDLIGISLMTNYFENAIQVTLKLKRHLKVPIVWGGIHPTIRPEECLNYADIACVGEGEESLTELVSKMEAGEDICGIEGLWLKGKNNIIRNTVRPLIRDLDIIPFQDYDCEDHYAMSGRSLNRMSEVLLKKYTAGRYLTMATRGCPYGCSYCANNTINRMYPGQDPVRKRSVDNIIEELMLVKAKLSAMDTIYFDDDAFFLYTTEEIEDFSKKYREEIKLPFVVTGVTPVTLTKDKLALLIDAGLIRIRMGIQSGSERTKRLYRRDYSNKKVAEAANIINEFRDKLHYLPRYDIIIDNPWETEDDLIETLMFLTKLPPPHSFTIYSLTLYPGTELYQKAKEEGMIRDDRKDIYHKHYHRDCKRPYLNRLFFLLHDLEGRLSTETMSLLTNRILMRLKLNWLVYYAVILYNFRRHPFYLRCKNYMKKKRIYFKPQN